MSSKNQRTAQSIVYGLVRTFIFIVFILPLGCIADRPSAVSPERDENFLRASKDRWLSAAFYVALPLYLFSNHGVWGFAVLPLTVLVVARRLSASRGGAPYLVRDLYDHITELLQTSWARAVVLAGTAVALLLQTGTLIWPFMGFLSWVAATVVLGAWIYLASAAADQNITAVKKEIAAREKYTPILSQAFATPVASWAQSDIVDSGLRITITNPPPAAVLHREQANAVLAQIAPTWEVNLEESNHDVVILVEASEETIQRREEEAKSGGLIGGEISDAASTHAPPVYTGLVITADQLV